MLLHIYCTKVLVAKLYYSTYISQLWSGDSNQISEKVQKEGKRSCELFRDIFSVTGQGRKPRPGLGSLPWPAPLWAPFTRTPSGRPSHASSARWSTAESPRLHRATEWEVWSVKLAVSFWFPTGFQRASWLRWLRYFLLEIVKKTVNP